jgi:uncharacterized membrane protein YedE/YeeE
MELAAAFFCAALFAFGLGYSGLLDPHRIQRFLDVAGDWNPGPLLVMASAMTVYFVGYRLVRKRPHPLFAGKWHLPIATDIDAPLVGGAALFGVGWGLSGFCPGPAVAGLALLKPETALFVGAMLVGAAIVQKGN